MSVRHQDIYTYNKFVWSRAISINPNAIAYFYHLVVPDRSLIDKIDIKHYCYKNSYVKIFWAPYSNNWILTIIKIYVHVSPTITSQNGVFICKIYGCKMLVESTWSWQFHGETAWFVLHSPDVGKCTIGLFWLLPATFHTRQLGEWYNSANTNCKMNWQMGTL